MKQAQKQRRRVKKGARSMGRAERGVVKGRRASYVRRAERPGTN